MAGTKISALPASGAFKLGQQIPINDGGVTRIINGTMVRQFLIPSDASTATVSAGYAADTYLANSTVTVLPGQFTAQSFYYCCFDLTKTGAGTAGLTVTVRCGTAGTTADTALNPSAFGVGTANADTGLFEVWATFRVGGASSVVAWIVKCSHHLAATGLVTTGSAGIAVLTGQSGAFDSTLATKIGVSVNGGASFSGTNTFVSAYALGFS